MSLHRSSDPNIFLLPDLGEGVHEAELISWKVAPGDSVDEHQIIAEMETDKALVEVPSPRAGVIAELRGNPGDILKVGEPAWTYRSSDAPSLRAGADPEAARKAVPPPPHNNRASDEDREDAGTVVGNLSANPAVEPAEGKALATPAVRRIARDLGVDIDSVAGTGLAGRVTEKDVRAAAGGRGEREVSASNATPSVSRLATTISRREVVESHGHAPSSAPLAAPSTRTTLVPAPGGETQHIPIRGVRRTIAARLRESVDRAVHFTVMDEADATNLDDVRKRLGAASGEKLSYLPFVASALCRALKRFPSLNALVDDERQEIVRYSSVHLGIATDTEHGLTVPVIPNADAMGVLELGRHISEVARMSRDRTIPRDRLGGSTVTISNVGSYAGRFATPIINYPEVGILAVGRVRDGVVPKHGGIAVAQLLPLSLTCDHRSVDGAEAARCLAYLMELLGRAEELLTPARG